MLVPYDTVGGKVEQGFFFFFFLQEITNFDSSSTAGISRSSFNLSSVCLSVSPLLHSISHFLFPAVDRPSGAAPGNV